MCSCRILCEPFERVVGKDNGVQFQGVRLQVPADRYRCHSGKAKITVRRQADGPLSVHHGPLLLDRDNEQRQLSAPTRPVAA